MDGYVGLLNKYNYRLERECEDIKATIKTVRMTVQKQDNDHHQSIFHSGLKRWTVLTDTSEIQRTLKDMCVQMTFYSCFTYLYSRIFHLSKLTTSESTWDSLLCQEATATTDVKNINTIVVTDWRSFIVPCP